MSILRTKVAHKLSETTEEKKWLIEKLWVNQGVGIIGGEPKCCKSFMALDMAVSVASGKPCLRQYPVNQTGRVLLYAAEDDLSIVKSRLKGICKAAEVSLVNLDILAITEPRLRLDFDSDREHLTDTINELRPKLLILDPFIRLHQIDENHSGEVAPILAFLRSLNRRFQMAIVVVHHARKRAGSERGGQALRGSSEFHAWIDSSLHLRKRKGDNIYLSTEHRSAKSMPDITLALNHDDGNLALELVDEDNNSSTTLSISAKDRIVQALTHSQKPLTVNTLRSFCKMRKTSVSSAVADLISNGQVKQVQDGYCLVEVQH